MIRRLPFGSTREYARISRISGTSSAARRLCVLFRYHSHLNRNRPDWDHAPRAPSYPTRCWCSRNF